MTTQQNSGSDSVLSLLGFIFSLVLGLGVFFWSDRIQEEHFAAAQEAALPSYKLTQLQDYTQLAGLKCKVVTEIPAGTTTIVVEGTQMSGRWLTRAYVATTLMGIPEGFKYDMKVLQVQMPKGANITTWACETPVTSEALATIIKGRDRLDPPCNVEYYIGSALIEMKRSRSCFPF